MYIVKMFEIVFSINVINFHGYIILDLHITYINVSVLCQSKCACLYKQ